MKFISEARQWYKMWSVWFFALVGVYQWLEANWAALDATIPENMKGAAGVVLAVLGIIARLIKQSGLRKE